jgi:hypothetical protein
MAARIPKLSEKALLRIAEASQAEGLTPDAVVLKFVPATPKKAEAPDKALTKAKPKKSDYLKRVEAGVKALRKDPKAMAKADKRLFGKRPPKIVEDEEANRLADEAVRKYRAEKSKARKLVAKKTPTKSTTIAKKPKESLKAFEKRIRAGAAAMSLKEAETKWAQRKGGMSERKAGELANKALAEVRRRRK